jgi:hypothetical protein
MPGHVAAVALMFTLTVFGWLLFRETDIGRIGRLLTLDPFAATSAEWVATAVMLTVTFATALPLVLGLIFDRFVLPKIERFEWWLPVQTTTWAFYALCFYVFVRMDAIDFIYFQF